MTNETVPELPEWVKVLIDDARQEGYSAGRADGMQYAYSDMSGLAQVRARKAW